LFYTTVTQTNVPAYASANFEQEGLSQLSNNVPYSAKITGTGNIAPIVNIYGRAAANNQLYLDTARLQSLGFSLKDVATFLETDLFAAAFTEDEVRSASARLK